MGKTDSGIKKEKRGRKMSDKKDLRITPAYWKQIKILMLLKATCKKYLKEKEYAICSHQKNDTKYMREFYREGAKTYRSAILFTFELWNLPLLQSWWYSGLKASINEIIDDQWIKNMEAYRKLKDQEEVLVVKTINGIEGTTKPFKGAE